jgi:hypothetical protein
MPTKKHTPHDLELPQSWRDLESVLAANLSRVCLYGPPGTGKTFAALTVAEGQPPAERVTCTDDMTSAQIDGLWRPSREGWTYQEGPAVRAWRAGSRLVVDEVDKASGDVLGTLLAFTDSEQSARWTNPDTGQVVHPHRNFQVWITTNTEPHHLPDALLSRFPVRLEIREPHPSALAALPPYLRDTARTLAQLDADDPNRADLRTMLALATLAEKIGMAEAARIIVPRHTEALQLAAAAESVAK